MGKLRFLDYYGLSRVVQKISEKFLTETRAREIINDNKPYYMISRNLTNVIIDNTIDQIKEGYVFSAQLSPSENLTINDIAVIMGGVDVAPLVYSNGHIYINSVNGNLLIKATADEQSVPEEGIVGNINTSNIITLMNLPSGTYTLKYEDENDNVIDSFDVICTMEV